MKTIGVYKFDANLYNVLIPRLEQVGIKLRSLEDGKVEADIDLYIFDADEPTDFENIKFERPFIIISALNDSKYLIRSSKLGALDFIFKPFTDIELTVKRIQRVLEKQSDAGNQIKNVQNEQFDKLIEIELKRAQRGKYTVALANLVFDMRLNREAVIRVIDKLKTILRDSDSCIPYSDSNIIIILPFADKLGSVIVARKITDLMSSLGYKNYCLGSVYPEDGETREELMNNFGKSVDTRNIHK